MPWWSSSNSRSPPGVMFIAYALWAFEAKDLSSDGGWLYQLSILPFVLAVLRYALVVEGGEGAEPEEIFLGDRALQVFALAWAIVFGAAVYAG